VKEKLAEQKKKGSWVWGGENADMGGQEAELVGG